MRKNPSLRSRGRLDLRTAVLLWAAILCFVSLNVSTGVAKEPTRKRDQATQDKSDCDQLRKRVSDLDKYRQLDYLRDLLTKEEQRAEALQAQLVDIADKESPLQTRSDQLDEQLRPENIDQALAGVGSLRPEEQKEALRRRLTNDKRRVQLQLDQLHQNRTRVQAALAGVDASMQRLRLRITDASKG